MRGVAEQLRAHLVEAPQLSVQAIELVVALALDVVLQLFQFTLVLLGLLPATGSPLLDQWRSQLRRPSDITLGSSPLARRPTADVRS